MWRQFVTSYSDEVNKRRIRKKHCVRKVCVDAAENMLSVIHVSSQHVKKFSATVEWGKQNVSFIQTN